MQKKVGPVGDRDRDRHRVRVRDRHRGRSSSYDEGEYGGIRISERIH